MEAIGLAASLVSIAGAGVSVVSTLTKFGISLRGSNDKINSLAGRVSITASILSDIATTVEQNASGFKKEEFWRTWRKVLSSCEESYEKLDQALTKARRSVSGKEKGGKDGMSVWRKLVWALGGEDEMQDLESSLERCCQQVMMMQQAVQMSVLSLIAQRQKLSSDEIEDQRELMSKLQWLLSTLSEAGVLPTKGCQGRVIVIDDKNPDCAVDSSNNSLGSPATPKQRPMDPLKEHCSAATVSSGLESSVNPTSDVDLAESGVSLMIDKDLGPGGPSGPSFGLSSFQVHTVLPQPTPRVPTEDGKPFTQHSLPEEKKPFKSKDYFFEAYYIIPRSVPRSQPRGQLQLTKPVPDDHMIICLDTRKDYRKDPNLRNALRRAKRAQPVTASTVNDFPRNVRETALALVSDKQRHANGLTWSLVEGVQLQVLEDSMFRKSSSKSGFLVVFRGTVPQLTLLSPTSVLKEPATDAPWQSSNQFQSSEVKPDSSRGSTEGTTNEANGRSEYTGLSKNKRSTSRPLARAELFWMAGGKPTSKQKSHRRKKVVTDRTYPDLEERTAVIINNSNSATIGAEDYDSGSESRRRGNKTTKFSTEGVSEEAIDQKRQRSQAEKHRRKSARRRSYRSDSGVDDDLDAAAQSFTQASVYTEESAYTRPLFLQLMSTKQAMVTQQDEADLEGERERMKYEERFLKHQKKVGKNMGNPRTVTEVIPSSLQIIPASQDSEIGMNLASSSAAGAALGAAGATIIVDRVRRKEERRKTKTHAGQGQRLRKSRIEPYEFSEPTKYKSDQEHASERGREQQYEFKVENFDGLRAQGPTHIDKTGEPVTNSNRPPSFPVQMQQYDRGSTTPEIVQTLKSSVGSTKRISGKRMALVGRSSLVGSLDLGAEACGVNVISDPVDVVAGAKVYASYRATKDRKKLLNEAQQPTTRQSQPVVQISNLAPTRNVSGVQDVPYAPPAYLHVPQQQQYAAPAPLISTSRYGSEQPHVSYYDGQTRVLPSSSASYQSTTAYYDEDSTSYHDDNWGLEREEDRKRVLHEYEDQMGERDGWRYNSESTRISTDAFERLSADGSTPPILLSSAFAEDSEPTISDFSSESGDEESTLVENKEVGDGEELHLSQQEAQDMMMNFLATFTAVPA